LVASETSVNDQARLDAQVAELSIEEARVFRLMREGVRDTAAYARALGIADRPRNEQKATVKQIKDRLLKRFKRSLREAGNE
jgi:tRNA C32,U32 (ribose-2'-O)-methylase TrmJ